MTTQDIVQTLNDLETRLARDLSLLELPAKAWVPNRHCNGQLVRDVIIVGAGMCGLAAAAKLHLSGVQNVVLYDAAPRGLEGPWETFARMKTLRSPKSLAGPALGLPALTFRAWFEAQWGAAAFDEMDKIPKGMWMDYLCWYRDVLKLPVTNETRVSDIQQGPDGLIALTISDANGTRQEHCRHLVLATGRSGLGGGSVPGFLSDVDPRFWAHSADNIDFEALKGKRVIVIGAGASAMDNAATVLEAGAAQVDMLIRRKDMPRVNKMTGIGSQGVVHGMRFLPDAWKYRFFDYVNAQQVPPPRSSTLRVSEHPNSRIFMGCPVEDIQIADNALEVVTPHKTFTVDYVIAATGFRNDFTGRDEFSAFSDHIKTWKDGVYCPEMGRGSAFMNDAPYLGDSFEFLEKDAGTCPMLARIHCFNDAAMLSHGKLSGDIPAISAGAERLTRGIIAAIFASDVETHFERLQSYNVAELQGDEWVDASESLLEVAK